MKQFKQNIYYGKEPLDGKNNKCDNDDVVSITSRICKVCIETQGLPSDSDNCFVWS